MSNRRYRLATVLLSLLALPAGAQTFGLPLSVEQVECEERQLERLQHRMEVRYEAASLFLWRASSTGGVYRGLSSTNELYHANRGKPSRQESQLAFDLLFKAREDFLDPRRPSLPQATLVRRDAESNLNATNRPYLDVNLDLAPEVPDPTNPRLPLRITNQRTTGAGHDDRATRGIAIDDFLGSCHSEVSEFDLRVFSIFARTVRPAPCLLEPLPHCNAGIDRFRVVFFRGASPLTYRMNIHSYLVGCYDDGHCEYGEARMAFLFHLQVDDNGRLIGGDLQTLPWCTGPGQFGCSWVANPNFALFVLPPLRPGIDRQGEAQFLRAAHLNLEYQGSPNNVLQDTVNWLDLLRDTAWNEGWPVSPGSPKPEG